MDTMNNGYPDYPEQDNSPASASTGEQNAVPQQETPPADSGAASGAASGTDSTQQQPADQTSTPQSAYHSAYQASYTPPYSNPNASYAAKPTKTKPPKKSSGRLTGKIVALAVACALLGSIGGGAIVAAVAHHSLQDNTSKTSTVTQKEETSGSSGNTSAAPQTVSSNSGDKSMSPSDVYSKYVSAVVGIANEGTSTNVFGQTSSTASSGSGFIISEDGYIVTNYHVIEGAQTLTVSLYDGTEYKATVVGYESTSDVALLKIDATGLTAVAIGDSDTLAVGDRVAAIGNPLGELTYTMTVGYISATDREINTDGTPINMLQTDAAINAGNSGGPLFDMNGNVVGITTAKYSGSTSSGTVIEGLGFAIPINDVMNLIPDLKQYGYVTGQAYLGVSIRDLDSTTAENYNLPLGAYVLSVNSDSCAEKAGLNSGDIITAIGDTTVKSYTELSAALKTFSAGDSTTLTVYRSGQTLTLDITLDEKPQNTQSSSDTTQQSGNDAQQGTPQTPGNGQSGSSGGSNPFSYFFGQ